MTSFSSLLILCGVVAISVAYPARDKNDEISDEMGALLLEELLTKKSDNVDVMAYLESLSNEKNLQESAQQQDILSGLETAMLEAIIEMASDSDADAEMDDEENRQTQKSAHEQDVLSGLQTAILEEIVEMAHDSDADAEGLDCPALDNPMNGNIMYNVSEDGRYTVEYNCNENYKLVGASSRVCEVLEEGVYSWSPDSTPECLVDCGELMSPTNGIVQSDGTTERSIAAYSCDGEFSLSGIPERTCQSDGTWSGEKPVCIEIPHCKSLCDPQNGRVTYSNSTYVGSVGTYSCNGDYYRVGSRTRTCTPEEKWSSTVPNCLKCKKLLKKCGSTSECCGKLKCKKALPWGSKKCHLL